MPITPGLTRRRRGLCGIRRKRFRGRVVEDMTVVVAKPVPSPPKADHATEILPGIRWGEILKIDDQVKGRPLERPDLLPPIIGLGNRGSPN